MATEASSQVNESPMAGVAPPATEKQRAGSLTTGAARRRNGPPRSAGLLAALAACCCSAEIAGAVTPESPEVLALVEKGLAFLESRTDDRLGGKCLVGLAFKKAGRPADHPQIRASISACQSSLGEMRNDQAIYSKALAVIFLSELDAAAHRDLIDEYAKLMEVHRKPHGGYGYQAQPTGDTSQTQYAALAHWELLQHGRGPTSTIVERCANWLLRTQSPEGAWGYLGRDPGSFERMPQTKTSPCMLAAGLSSVLICGDMLGVLRDGGVGPTSAGEPVLPALRRKQERRSVRGPKLASSGAVDRNRMRTAWADGREWMDKNFTIDNGGRYSCYYLYALERYKSFEEHLEGNIPPEPEWYLQGYEYLKEHQRANGSWTSVGDSGEVCSTAFAVLFLLRSTKGSLGNLGQGTFVGGRGLPRDLSKARLKNGKLVIQAKPTSIDQLLGLIEQGDDDSLQALLDDPAALRLSNVGVDQARRLEQTVRSGGPETRLLAVRALARLRNVDYAPTMVYAMTDPDPRVVRAARDGLRSVSRRFEGFGLPDQFDDKQRFLAIEKWKQWYALVRPDAPPIP